MPKQLCSGQEFRLKIAGSNQYPSIIEKHKDSFGIPQGAPLSDLLANLYLIEFDELIANRVRSLGGMYYRYSDDILVIVPSSHVSAVSLEAEIRTSISSFGSNLKIKEAKSSIVEYSRIGAVQNYRLIMGKGKNGIEYLGFRYDGKRAYVRESTISNLRRKVAKAAKSEAISLVRRYPDKSLSQLLEKFDYENFIQRFSKVKDIDEKIIDHKNWTFWTYAKRASKIFGANGTTILKQLKNHRKLTKNRIEKEIINAHSRIHSS